MMSVARLVRPQGSGATVVLDPRQPLTIGSDASNRLRLSAGPGVSPHHAVVRYSRGQACWLVCDWQSQDGTFLEGQRVRQCRAISDGDQIRLGLDGPTFLFECGRSATDRPPVSPGEVTPAHSQDVARVPAPAAVPAARPAPVATAAVRSPRRVDVVQINGQSVPMAGILQAEVRSEARYPHSFSWWLLIAVSGLILLPIRVLFWPLEGLALAALLVLGSRKDHRLQLTLRDGQVQRHTFRNKMTALAHRNGIRENLALRNGASQRS